MTCSLPGTFYLLLHTMHGRVLFARRHAAGLCVCLSAPKALYMIVGVGSLVVLCTADFLVSAAVSVVLCQCLLEEKLMF